MNIIIVNDSASITGGAGKVAINSAIELSKRGYNVLLFSAMGPIDQRLIDSGVKVVCLHQKDILSEPNRLKAIVQGVWNNKAKLVFKNLLSSFSPEDTIIHLHAWIKAISPSILSVIKSCQFETFFSLHDYFTFCPNGGLYNYRTKRICTIKPSSFKCYLSNCDSRSYFQKIWRDLRQMIQKSVLPQLNIIALGNMNKNVSYNSLNSIAKRWFVLQNPIELNLKTPVNIINNTKYLFMARLSSEKGAEMFCEVVTSLGLKGIVLGDGPLRKELECKYPNIEFAGWVVGEDKEKFINQAKALIFPSLWYEGSPLTTLEIKSYGIPCIVSDKCAASEQIVDGVDGFIFKMGDIDSLKETLIKFEKVDLENMQKQIINDFDCSDYSIDTHINKLIDIYKSVF